MKLFPVSFIQGEIWVTQPETTKTGTRKKNVKRSFWTRVPGGTAAEELHRDVPCSFLHHSGKLQHHWATAFKFGQLCQHPAQELPKHFLFIHLPWKEKKRQNIFTLDHKVTTQPIVGSQLSDLRKSIALVYKYHKMDLCQTGLGARREEISSHISSEERYAMESGTYVLLQTRLVVSRRSWICCKADESGDTETANSCRSAQDTLRTQQIRSVGGRREAGKH